MRTVVTDAGGPVITVVTCLQPLNVFYAIRISKPLSRKSETGLGCYFVFVDLTSVKKKMVIGPSKALCVALYRNHVSMNFNCC